MSADSEPRLRLRGVVKNFGQVRALRDVSFEARAGRVHALCGENGAGKSTLMKILAGVHRPDAGSIELDGRPRRFATPAAALDAGISMIYQELDLAEDLSVAENVYLGAEPGGRIPLTVDRGRMLALTRELAALHGFTIDAAAKVADLSAGDRQIVEILKALRRRASILVMDEPTSSLADAEARRLLAVVRELSARGLAIIYISHRLEEVMSIADDISVMRDGCLVYSAPRSALDAHRVVRYMVGRELSEYFPPRKAVPGRVRLGVRQLASAEGLSDITFEVRAGEVVGVAGLLGSGRTRLARALFGLSRRTSGELVLDGRALEHDSPAAAIASGVALLTEDRKRTGLWLDLPASWNITLPNLCRLGMHYLVRPAKELAAARDLGARLGVKWPSTQIASGLLSGGNQQKLLIARWLLADPHLLIFDEPTRGIDVGAKREIYEVLNGLARDGKALLVISSELPELFGMTDRILVMRGGRLAGEVITAQSSPEEVMQLAAA
ncbi:MAG: sugar ABC transporter ATP-binding protein [Proteobacteria bacterium]|nr:sugar ABC transporter ATP-binding protein [Pseudomonadota bacterium]